MKKIAWIFLVIMLWAGLARADNRYVPPFIMRLTNTYWVRVTNNETTNKRARCIALITSGTGAGTVVVTDLDLTGNGGTGDCKPNAGIEWNLQAIIHQGNLTIGSHDGTNLLNFDTDPATATTTGVYQADFKNQTEPTTPASGFTAVYTDSVDKVLCGKDDTGTVNCLGGAVNLPASAKVRDCEIVFGSKHAGSAAISNDDDVTDVCGNDFGVDYTITAVACLANTADMTVTPILTGGSSTSILTGALSCGNGTWATGTISGTPTVHTFNSNGSTCGTTPCTIDSNVTAGGTATYAVVRIKRTMP